MFAIAVLMGMKQPHKSQVCFWESYLSQPLQISIRSVWMYRGAIVGSASNLAAVSFKEAPKDLLQHSGLSTLDSSIPRLYPWQVQDCSLWHKTSCALSTTHLGDLASPGETLQKSGPQEKTHHGSWLGIDQSWFSPNTSVMFENVWVLLSRSHNGKGLETHRLICSKTIRLKLPSL